MIHIWGTVETLNLNPQPSKGKKETLNPKPSTKGTKGKKAEAGGGGGPNFSSGSSDPEPDGFRNGLGFRGLGV